MEREILKTAGELFSQYGYNQTRLQDIADAIGVSRPSLYHYFDNREQILAAGIGEITRERDRVIEELATVREDPVERLEFLIKGLGQLAIDNPLWIGIVIRDGVALPEEVRDREYQSRQVYFDILVTTLHECIEKGYVRPLDEPSTAHMIISSLIGLQGHYTVTIDISSDEAASMAVDLILHGVLEPDRRIETPLDRGFRMINDGLKLIKKGTDKIADLGE